MAKFAEESSPPFRIAIAIPSGVFSLVAWCEIGNAKEDSLLLSDTIGTLTVERLGEKQTNN